MAKIEQIESKIVEAAQVMFLEKGFEATSTTDIAKKAGCNQALVHYYFRTKEKLFFHIFSMQFELMMSHIKLDGQEVDSLKEVIVRFVDCYFYLLSKNRNLPFFIVNELINNQQRRVAIAEFMHNNVEYNHYYQTMDQLVKKEIAHGTIRPIDTIDLALNVISLVVFTFISLPLYTDFFNQNSEEIEHYLSHRKQEVIELITRGVFLSKGIE